MRIVKNPRRPTTLPFSLGVSDNDGRHFLMKLFATSVVVLGCLLSVAIAQTPLEPTRMEAFATRRSSHVTWSREIGRIAERETQATVTAVILEDSAAVGTRIRGIRIDLSNEKSRDQIYLDEQRLGPIRNALLEIERGVESYRKEQDPTPIRYYGAAEFWRPNEHVHTLNAAYFIRPGSQGLSVSAYKPEEFRFPGHRPIELADLISRAIQVLNQQ